jgi:hypothetical protein
LSGSPGSFLAYHFVHLATAPPTADELDGRIAASLQKTSALTLISKSAMRPDK